MLNECAQLGASVANWLMVAVGAGGCGEALKLHYRHERMEYPFLASKLPSLAWRTSAAPSLLTTVPMMFSPVDL